VLDEYDGDENDPNDIDEEDLFDDTNFRGTSHTELDQRLMDAVDKARDHIKSLTVDQFIQEAYVAGTQLRNILGDADGFAADLAETIRTNLVVVLTELRAKPAEMLVKIALSFDDPVDQLAFLTDAEKTLHDLANQIMHKTD
jgi:flavin-binding protein dodecin